MKIQSLTSIAVASAAERKYSIDSMALATCPKKTVKQTLFLEDVRVVINLCSYLLFSRLTCVNHRSVKRPL